SSEGVVPKPSGPDQFIPAEQRPAQLRLNIRQTIIDSRYLQAAGVAATAADVATTQDAGAADQAPEEVKGVATSEDVDERDGQDRTFRERALITLGALLLYSVSVMAIRRVIG